MTYLILSIVFTTILVVIFKLFPKYNINEFNAITINYYFCFLMAWLTLGEFPIAKTDIDSSYFPYAIILSLFFIFGFTIVAITVKKYGIAFATIMQKMSLILPVGFALYYLNETFSIFKISGLILALFSIILINLPQKGTPRVKLRLSFILLPFLTWFMSGVIEIGLLYLSTNKLVIEGDPKFFALLFGFAGLMGTIILIIKFIKNGKKPSKNDLIAGMALGIPNFFSMYFLIKTLGLQNGGSTILPINNVAIIVLSALLAIFIFKEKLSKINLIGIFFAILSIIIIGLA